MDGNKHELSAVALTTSGPHDISAGSSHPEMDMITPEQLQEMIWFFRTEDPSMWNYCILALSFAVLLLGIVLVAINTMANRNRKATLSHSEEYKAAQPDGTEIKQAFVSLKEDAAAEGLLPGVYNAGEVTVQWKDGNVTTLYPGVAEEDV
uniref:organic solute transporter subunit beta n=1 Tax=Euleptes europaea TaxID=460621 RepID=UPI00254191B4|nr:organic solute transporter subunit beta [Euleptes europaea]